MIAKLKRREFITLVGAAVAWPLAARAQQSERVRRLGALMSGAETDPEMQARLAGFRQGLVRFGWTDERNIHVDYRFAAANMDRAQETRERVDRPKAGCARGVGN